MKLSIFLGKIIQKIARLRGGGSALPGLFIERFNPKFLARTLECLPYGVVVISGTNGKTTTTKMVVELLESQNLRVFTNKTGSNFVRGVAAAALESVNLRGILPADIAVLELDEAHAVHFVEQIHPRYSLLLNVMRDQLDRFGEIDFTACLLQKIGENTRNLVVLNGGDNLLSRKDFSKGFAKVVKFGSSEKLAEFFPNDEEIHGDNSSALRSKHPQDIDYLLEDFSKTSAQIIHQETRKNFNLQISGIHNILNLTAAYGLVREILKSEKIKILEENLEEAISEIKPAFGRGEIIKIGEKEVEIMLVKNPAGFRSNLKSADLSNAQIMIAINDNYADGRDMSWLWDVEFSKMLDGSVTKISGIRAYDMALRLFHDEIPFENTDINTDIRSAVEEFLSQDGDKKKIFATYTAMLEIRKEISKLTEVEKIL